MKTNLSPCTVCGSKRASFLFERESDGNDVSPLSIYRCDVCANVYLGLYDSGYIDDLYEYYRKYLGKPKDELFSPLTALSYMKVLGLFARHNLGKRILDVGCGKGDFVDVGLRSGWEVSGIELAQPAVEIAQSFGLPVNQCDFFSNSIKSASFDIVTMFEVLEHLPNPVEFLKRAENVVKPGGLVYLTTPNFDCFDRIVLGADWPVIHREHLSYFTLKILMQMIRENTNLVLMRVETRNVSVQSLQKIKGYLLGHNKLSNISSQEVGHDIGNVDVRELIERSCVLQFIKRFINLVLNATSSGNTIVLLLKRPQ